MLSLPRQFLHWLARVLIRGGIVEPFVWLCARAIWLNDPIGDGEVTILALNESRFRGDLECLARTGKFRVYKVPFYWQGRVYLWFYESGDDCFKAGENPIIAARQARFRALLRNFLARLYDRLGVDLVLGAAVHYRQDYDWGAVSHQIGTPYVIFHREGNLTSKATQDACRARGREWGKFHGTALVLQSEVQRGILIESGFVDEKNSYAAGIIRMDSLVRAAALPRQARAKGRQRVVFFSFGPSTGILSGKPPNWPANPRAFLYEFTRLVHVAVARLAQTRPDVDVVIKPKWGGRWSKEIREILSGEGIDIDRMPNLSIDAEANVQALLCQTDVVIGFNSTTLLEAAIMDLPVILPVFAEIAEPRWHDYLMFADELGCFDVAHSPEELQRLIERRLASPEIAVNVQRMRRRVFEKYVSTLDGTATARYQNILLSYIRPSAAARSGHGYERVKLK
jgi:hypothetical protein